MSVNISRWCNYCETPFASNKYLKQHQYKSKVCRKYRDILFCCERCGIFRTKGLKNIELHLEGCTGVISANNVAKGELESLRKALVVEKTRSAIYTSIIASLHKVSPESLWEQKEGNLNLINVNEESEIFLKRVLPPGKLHIDTSSQTTIHDTYRQINKKYRRVTKIESNPEPTKHHLNQAIILHDTRSNASLKKLNEGNTQDVTSTCMQYIEQLGKSRVYTRLLKKIRTFRSKLLGTIQLEEYISIVRKHVVYIEDIFKNKHQSDKKIKSNTLLALTPLEARLLRYTGFTDTQMDADCRERFKALLKYGNQFPKKFAPFNLERISTGLTNYSVVVFPIDRLVRWMLINPYRFWNVVYLPLPKSTNTDPFSFYVLRTTKKGKRYWNMDCRLENLTCDLASCLQPYLINTFRELYYNVFIDNNYRPNYMELSMFAAEDCEQLAHNIVLLSQPRKFGMKLRKLLVTECTYRHTDNDSFSLTGDDAIQRKRFQNREKVEMVNTVRQLFDEISDDQAVEFYKSRNTV